ncbi:MAG: hypothetical protein AAFR96_07145 [Planctomycetota bacterium]
MRSFVQIGDQPAGRLARARALLAERDEQLSRGFATAQATAQAPALATAPEAAARALAGQAELVTAPGVHEWLTAPGPRGLWLPPLAALIGLAWQAIEQPCQPSNGCSATGPRSAAGRVCWIGRSCWPFAHALLGRDPSRASEPDRALLNRSIFVDARKAAERLWAADLAARSPGIAMVIADGRSLDMAASRRLQLAAVDTPVLLARPDSERAVLSAARTRWLVVPEATGSSAQRWRIEMLRNKATPTHPSQGARHRAVQRDHATGYTRDVQLAQPAPDRSQPDEHRHVQAQARDGDPAHRLADRPFPPTRAAARLA